MASSEIRPFWETGLHSYHRRAFAHDYHAPFIYHIILKKASGCEAFGHVEGDARIAHGSPGCAEIRETDLGQIIAKSLLHLPYEYPSLKLLQFCVMPDHVHLLLQVLRRSDKHLDFYIESLKTTVAAKYSEKNGKTIAEEAIFEPGYCDRPLYGNRSLDGLYRYIRENPHRLAMRRQFPQFFQRVRKIRIDNEDYEAYGNLFLLRNPDKQAVKISRKFAPEELEQKKSRWLMAAAGGTVLVSPFISPAEKAIRAEAETLNGKIILILHEAIPERFKPSAHDFALCAQGHLLILSLREPPKTELTRALCLRMNALAETIATAP
ncbi:MAG: transposase [Muribaculaceae bacterium]|nr:transposase [Muribaculaceae bacterium]